MQIKKTEINMMTMQFNCIGFCVVNITMYYLNDGKNNKLVKCDLLLVLGRKFINDFSDTTL